MSSVTFDALAYYEKLIAAGVAEEQAKVQANALKEVFENRIAARDYMDAGLRELELRLKYDLAIRLGGIVVACTAILLAALPMLLR